MELKIIVFVPATSTDVLILKIDPNVAGLSNSDETSDLSTVDRNVSARYVFSSKTDLF